MIASCRATFCDRPGTFTRTTAGTDEATAATREGSSSDNERTSWTGIPNPRANRGDVAGGWRAEEPLEQPRLDLTRLGKEREDPSPTVVHHHEGARDVGHVDETRDIMKERQVAQQCQGATARF